MNDNVIPLFGGDPPPAAEDSDFVAEFTEEHLGNFLFEVQGLTDAVTEDAFTTAMDAIRVLVEGWPDGP
jgi:hypothetical protein